MSQTPQDAASGPSGGVLIIDFGAQYCQLIARRVREMSVYSRITVPERALFTLQAMRPSAIILSGGPRSVYSHDAPDLDAAILEMGIPVLGICYGLQWMAQALDGEVTPAQSGAEYGRTEIQITQPSALLEGVADNSVVWMSHGDKVSKLPSGFVTMAKSEPCPFCRGWRRRAQVLRTAVPPRGRAHAGRHAHAAELRARHRRCSTDWDPGHIVDQKIEQVKQIVGETGEVVLGLSGGVDSSVAAVIVHRAIGKRLHCVFVDNGLLREGERQGVEALFRDDYHMDLQVVDARDRFLDALKGVTDPEKKRKIIGGVFVDVFREKAAALDNAGFLGQGTLYPDVIESVAAHGGATSTIKSHHNVGGLPDDLDMELVEPLRDLFKDEVRAIGREMGLPSSLIDRQPFPGPGLGCAALAR